MKSILASILSLVLCAGIAKSFAAGGTVKSPTGTAPDRYVYYPGTEELAKGEIRLIACGTGLPAARRDQAANDLSHFGFALESRAAVDAIAAH